MLTEATLKYSDELQKIEDSERGYRPRNWKLCSLDKLLFDYEIATGNMYGNPKVFPKSIREIEHELKYRFSIDLANDPRTLRCYNSYHKPTQQQTTTKIDIQKLIFDWNDFHPADLSYLKEQIANNSIQNIINVFDPSEQDIHTKEEKFKYLIVELIFAIMIKEQTAIQLLQEQILKEISSSELKQIIHSIISNSSLIDRINSIISEE